MYMLNAHVALCVQITYKQGKNYDLYNEYGKLFKKKEKSNRKVK